MRNLQRSARALSCLGYNLLRSIELCCAWLPTVTACDGKMRLGREIGVYAMLLARTRERMFELAGAEGWVGRSEDADAYAVLTRTVLEDAAIEHAAATLRARLSTLLAQLLCDLDASLYATIDEPSHLLLTGAVPWLGTELTETAFDPDTVMVAYRGDELLPPLPTAPAREARLQLRSGPGGSLAEWVRTPEGRRNIVHEIFIDIEIPATEACAMNIVLFRDAPLPFKLDMARQVWDEARHATIALRRYQELGGELDLKSYSNNLWNRWSQGADVIDRLCIQQVVQEGNALDSANNLAEVLCEAGDTDSADMFAFFAADEELHTRFGNDWVLRFLNGDEAAYRARVMAAAELIGASLPGKLPVNVPSRLRGGFTPGLVEDLLNRQAERAAQET